MIKIELWKFKALSEWKRLEMIWIYIVGVRIHQLCSHATTILHPLHQYANVNPQICSNPNSLLEWA